MKAKEIREKYLKFFEKKGHKIIPSASLVPENDPSVLFTTAGMHPLVPYLLGEKHPLGKRLANCQKCIRTGDIDEVGDETHLTFFEMLGNWSLGDYFKREAIEWSFEFLTKELKISLEKLAISVFAGEPENNIPRDDESAKIWEELGIPKERIAYLGREDNWWGPAGKTGPCGPDTEMFYWAGQESASAVFDPNDKRWVEIWNDVFMEYEKKVKTQNSNVKTTTQNSKLDENKEEYEFAPLKQKNVDTGMGLERVAAVLQGKDNVFETELFEPIIEKLKTQNSKLKTTTQNLKPEEIKALRIIADHLKASVFILAEGVIPSNVERGYILRRLIRRAIRYAKLIGIENGFTVDIAKSVIKTYEDVYPELAANQKFISDELEKEEKTFSECLDKGLKFFEKITPNLIIDNRINGQDAFNLYQNYGFPIEMTRELAKEKGILIDEQGFQEELRKHQKLSRTASAGQFKAGLADSSEKTTQLHTATHLLLAGLRKVLGKEVKQMGSNITSERIRFDFSFDRKLTENEIKQVEDFVNKAIAKNLTVKFEEMTVEQAQEQGALAGFRERYPEKVKVFTVFDEKTGQVFSKEICSGPHIENTGCLGSFKIMKEESSSQGVRRIKAVLMRGV